MSTPLQTSNNFAERSPHVSIPDARAIAQGDYAAITAAVDFSDFSDPRGPGTAFDARIALKNTVPPTNNAVAPA